MKFSIVHVFKIHVDDFACDLPPWIYRCFSQTPERPLVLRCAVSWRASVCAGNSSDIRPELLRVAPA